MAVNKAQQELQALLDMEADAEMQASNLAKMNEAQYPFAAGEMDDAEFAAPEALATAAGIGWVLGPVGGLVTGLAVGILGQRQKQSAIDAYNQEQQILESSNAVFDDEIDRLAVEAQSPEDLAQLRSLQAMKDAGLRYASSAYPETQATGQQMLSEFASGLNDYTVRQEQQLLDAEANRVALGNERYQRHRNLVGDFQRESGNFFAQQQSADNILQAVNKGDGASLTAALATLPLLVNPAAGATTDAEVEMWGGIGGTVDSLIGRVKKELGEGGMTDSTRKEIIGVATQFKRNTLTYQQAREAYYGEQAVSTEIPEQFWSEYNYSGRLPVVQNGGFVRGAELQDQAAEAGETVPSVVDRAGEAVDTAGNFVTDAIDAGSMWINDRLEERRHTNAWREEFFKIHGQYPADDLGGRLR